MANIDKKIALVSPHDEPNYGTMLQAYALAKAIENLGWKSEYITYESFVHRSLFQKVLYYLFNLQKLIKKISSSEKKDQVDDYSFFSCPEFATTMEKFESFYQKYIPHSSITYNPKTIHNITEYSKYIVGSDQTWSPNLYNSLSINLLSFVKNNSIKNAYAPSLGTTNIPEAFQIILKEKLAGFANLSCREKSNCELLERLTGQEVTHVLDPTLLLTNEQWDKVAQKVDMPAKYILCYILGEKKCISDFAELLGQEKNIPVYYIAIRPIYLQKKNSLKGICPSQLISLIKNATFVITDSFHGTIFSINYNRNFYCFAKRDGTSKDSDNGRILEVLKEFDLTERFRKDDDMNLTDDIFFNKVNSILEKRRLESIRFLNKILK